VPKQIQQAFVAAWRQREADMQGQPGFMGFNVISDGETYTVSSSWASIPEWEAWSLSEECRRSHLPQGIWQFVPKKGEGFPGGQAL
jgi:heme-degrading monooxygenase HmoA